MTLDEAIKRIEDHFQHHNDGRATPYLNMAVKIAIESIKENQKYKSLQCRLDDMFGGEITLKDAVDEIERNIIEPDNPNQVNARILTYQESRDWDMYREIGTVDECRKYKFLAKGILEEKKE